MNEEGRFWDTKKTSSIHLQICAGYYTTLKQQKLSTITEKFNVIDTNLVLVGWTGNIIAQFKNGHTMITNNYSVTNVFKKIEGVWKIIHSHKSSLPPEIRENLRKPKFFNKRNLDNL